MGSPAGAKLNAEKVAEALRGMTQRARRTYETIAGRLAGLDPPIRIDEYIAIRNGKSSLAPFEFTLDGFDFKTDEPGMLNDELHVTRNAAKGEKAFTSMREEPRHWALKLSLAATEGTGYREVHRPSPPKAARGDTPRPDSLMQMRFGSAGTRLEYTSLHCAVSSGVCNVHVDVTGFVIEAPDGGTSLTLDFYDHLANELLLKTKFRDWLLGLTDNATAEAVIREVLGRLSLHFPNSSNGFVGLRSNVQRITGLNNLLPNLGRILRPVGASFDVVDRDAFKVQISGHSVEGERSVTVTIGGAYDWDQALGRVLGRRRRLLSR